MAETSSTGRGDTVFRRISMIEDTVCICEVSSLFIKKENDT